MRVLVAASHAAQKHFRETSRNIIYRNAFVTGRAAVNRAEISHGCAATVASMRSREISVFFARPRPTLIVTDPVNELVRSPVECISSFPKGIRTAFQKRCSSDTLTTGCTTSFVYTGMRDPRNSKRSPRGRRGRYYVQEKTNFLYEKKKNLFSYPAPRESHERTQIPGRPKNRSAVFKTRIECNTLLERLHAYE